MASLLIDLILPGLKTVILSGFNFLGSWQVVVWLFVDCFSFHMHFFVLTLVLIALRIVGERAAHDQSREKKCGLVPLFPVHPADPVCGNLLGTDRLAFEVAAAAAEALRLHLALHRVGTAGPFRLPLRQLTQMRQFGSHE